MRPKKWGRLPVAGTPLRSLNAVMTSAVIQFPAARAGTPLAEVVRTLADRGQELVPIPGTPPDATNPPKGCPFTSRCPYAMKVCGDVMPEPTTFSSEHWAACWLYDAQGVGK